MPKVAKALSALEVKRLAGAGMHLVGTVAGLGLNISDTGSRSWILRTKMGSKRIEIGLGSYPDTTLSTAHERARAAKDEIKSGKNPIAERKAKRAIVEWTFKRCAEAYMETHRSEWRDKNAQQWENTLATYAYPKIGSMHVRDIALADVLRVIEADCAAWFTLDVRYMGAREYKLPDRITRACPSAPSRQRNDPVIRAWRTI